MAREILNINQPIPNDYVIEKTIPIKNRALDISDKDGQIKNYNIGIEDHDKAVLWHIKNVVKPIIYQNSQLIEVPVFLGNREVWSSIQEYGYYRDKDEKLLLPIISIIRTNVKKNSDMNNKLDANNPSLFRVFEKKYTNKNKYNQFSVLENTVPTKELYAITVPDYVTISYSVTVMTNFTEHMNKIVEAFNYASDSYWGEKNGLKFLVKIDGFDDSSEVDIGEERIIKSEFNIELNGYLLPDTINKELNDIGKFYSKSKIIINGDVVPTTPSLIENGNRSISGNASLQFNPNFKRSRIFFEEIEALPNTLMGYGIEDAYTKEEIDQLTLSGSNILINGGVSSSFSSAVNKTFIISLPSTINLSTLRQYGDSASFTIEASSGSPNLYLKSPSGLTIGGIQTNNSTGEIKLGAYSVGYFPTFYASGNEVGRFFANGRFAINTTTDSGYQFDVNGTGRFTQTLRLDNGLSFYQNTQAAIAFVDAAAANFVKAIFNADQFDLQIRSTSKFTINSTGDVTVKNATISTSTTNGALIVSGGLGTYNLFTNYANISSNLYVTGSIFSSGSIRSNGNIFVTGSGNYTSLVSASDFYYQNTSVSQSINNRIKYVDVLPTNGIELSSNNQRIIFRDGSNLYGYVEYNLVANESQKYIQQQLSIEDYLLYSELYQRPSYVRNVITDGTTTSGLYITGSNTNIANNYAQLVGGTSSLYVGTLGVRMTGIKNNTVGTFNILVSSGSNYTIGALQSIPNSVLSNSSIAFITSSANGLIITGSSVALGATMSLNLVQDINTTASPTFNNLTLNGNVTVGGNVTVNGTVTQINSTQVEIGDNIILLNKVSNVADAGIYVVDAISTSGTGSLLWDATNNFWKGGWKDSEYRMSQFSGSMVTNSFVSINSNGYLISNSSPTTIGDIYQWGGSGWSVTNIIDGGSY